MKAEHAHRAVPVEGDILAGKYRIERVLGVGGMGVVVAARHLRLHERVALKFLLPEHAENPDFAVRFFREAQSAAKIRSEHVARVSDVGTFESGQPYMVMELLRGHDLAALTERGQRLDVPTAVDYVLQAGEAVAEAHLHGIVHRDLKPSNLFLSRRADGSACVKVLDFGISKVVSPNHTEQFPHITGTSGVLGSPLYMSPEQMASARTVDFRADIWALGTILYKLVTGVAPFAADTVVEVCALILTEPPVPMLSLRPDVPPAFAAAVERCLAKERDARYANMGELAEALAPFAPPHARISVERIGRMSQSARSLCGPSEANDTDDDNAETLLVRPPDERMQLGVAPTEASGFRSSWRFIAKTPGSPLPAEPEIVSPAAPEPEPKAPPPYMTYALVGFGIAAAASLTIVLTALALRSGPEPVRSPPAASMAAENRANPNDVAAAAPPPEPSPSLAASPDAGAPNASPVSSSGEKTGARGSHSGKVQSVRPSDSIKPKNPEETFNFRQ